MMGPLHCSLTCRFLPPPTDCSSDLHVYTTGGCHYAITYHLSPLSSAHHPPTDCSFELHVYTMGDRDYAAEMAKLLDPGGTLFHGRIISSVGGPALLFVGGPALLPARPRCPLSFRVVSGCGGGCGSGGLCGSSGSAAALVQVRSLYAPPCPPARLSPILLWPLPTVRCHPPHRRATPRSGLSRTWM